ncbi:MAG: hypothetical protein ACT4QB_10255 [Gammaproteobacteria bacterium]
MSIEQLYTAAIQQLAREGRVPANPAHRPYDGAQQPFLRRRGAAWDLRRGKPGAGNRLHRTRLRVVRGVGRDHAPGNAGQDETSLAQAERFLCRLADGVPAPPPAGWEELARFEPLRRFRSRLDSVLLPMRALRQLLSDPSWSSPI